MAFGPHFSDVIANRVYMQQSNQTSIAGLAIPIFSATAVAGGNPLWNPPNSNRNVEIISVDIQYTSGTAAAEPIVIMAGQVSAIGTATGCSVFTSVAAINANLGGPNGSRIQSASGGTVTVTAGTATPPVNGVVGAGVVRTVAGINLEAATATAHPTVGGPTYLFNGTLGLPPGTIMYLASVASTTALYNITWVWAEYIISPSAG